MTKRGKSVARQLTKAVVRHQAVTDVFAHLRANRFRDALELPDRVLRSIASKAANTRLAIYANYKVWKGWCAKQRPPVNPYPADSAAVAAFIASAMIKAKD